MSGNRHTLPEQLPGATAFSDEPELLDPLWAVRRLKQNPQWLQLLEDATNLDRSWGRPRSPGSWALAYLAFVLSGRSDVEPWAATVGGAVWSECGFREVPSYQSTWLRFSELETVSDAFSGVAARLIRHARIHSDGAVGRDIHVDGTEAETNARLHHRCDPDSCQGHRRLKRLHPDEARELRHRDDAAPPDATDRSVDESNAGSRRSFTIGGCEYESLDTTAGVRAYIQGNRVKRFWHGFYNAKAIDHFTGAPVAVMVSSASEQEYHAYPRLLDEVCRALDDTPRAVVADKGYSIEQVFELNTKRGIASVMPYRPRNSRDTNREDTDEFDRHGIPRCKRCGGETEYVRFASDPSPRLWFRCLENATPDCARDQTIACSKGWRSLIPLWRIEPTYMALRESHSTYERVHNLWRTRYRVGAATHEMRPKRRGLGWQQLRANAALLIEWLRILDREGWMGSARRNQRSPRRTDAPAGVIRRLLNARKKYGVHLPYGPRAVALGIGPPRPFEAGREPPDAEPVPF